MGCAGLSWDLGDSGAWGRVRGAALRGMLCAGRRGGLGSGRGPRAQLTGRPACASCSHSSLGCPMGAPGSRRGAAPAGGLPGSQASDPVASRPRALVPPVHTAAELRLQPSLCVLLPGVSWRPWPPGHHVGKRPPLPGALLWVCAHPMCLSRLSLHGGLWARGAVVRPWGQQPPGRSADGDPSPGPLPREAGRAAAPERVGFSSAR